jgi:hypothetical protein
MIVKDINFLGVRFYVQKESFGNIEPVSPMIMNIPTNLFFGIEVYYLIYTCIYFYLICKIKGHYDAHIEIKHLRRLTKPPKIQKPRESDEEPPKSNEEPSKIDEEYIPGYDYKNWIKDVKITFNTKSDV